MERSSIVTAPGTFWPMMRLAMPVLIESILHVAVEYVDLVLVGWFLNHSEGQGVYVAAITQVGYLMWFLFTLFTLVGIGATALVARFVGAGDFKLANRVMEQSIIAGVILSAATMALMLPFASEVTSLLNMQGAAAVAAASYMQIVIPVMPAIMLETVAIACLRGAGDMITGLVVMAIVNVVNILVAMALVTGWGPFPDLGWDGLAYANAIARSLGGVILIVVLIRGRAGLRWSRIGFRPDFSIMRRILRVGIPGGIDSLLLVLCHLWFVTIINSLGTLQTAAHGIAIRVEALAYMPGWAFQMAAATLAGQYLGARDPQRAMRSVLMACAVAGVIQVAAAISYFVFAPEFAHFFLGDHNAAVVPITAKLLRIIAFVTPIYGVASVMWGALRGSGDVRVPILITLAGFLLVRIPFAYYLADDTIHLFGMTIAGAGLGVVGAWYAMAADALLRGLLLMLRFFNGAWRKIEV